MAATGVDWLSKVTGFGDYKVSSNSVYSSTTGVPSFSGNSHSIRVKHREFLGDILSSTAFKIQSFPIQPGDATTFPWLNQVATAFQEYSIKGLLFQFHSTSANALNSVNTALGTVVMATQYNPARPAFISKPEMEQYEFSCSSKPSCDLMHPIECMPKESPLRQLYIRSGDLPDGEVPQFYDFGTFYIATVGMQAEATIGELWVTYDIEFYKPRLLPSYQRVPSYWAASFVGEDEGIFHTLLAQSGDIPVEVEDDEITLTIPPGLERPFYFRIASQGNTQWPAGGTEPYLVTLTNVADPGFLTYLQVYCPSSSSTSAIWTRSWVFSTIDSSLPATLTFTRYPEVGADAGIGVLLSIL
jgi:hypothetical protein